MKFDFLRVLATTTCEGALAHEKETIRACRHECSLTCVRIFGYNEAESSCVFIRMKLKLIVTFYGAFTIISPSFT